MVLTLASSLMQAKGADQGAKSVEGEDGGEAGEEEQQEEEEEEEGGLGEGLAGPWTAALEADAKVQPLCKCGD